MITSSYKRGFTIVELLIVIVVIAILAAITIVAYNGIQTRSNNAKTLQAATAFVKAAKLYEVDHGELPHTSTTATLNTLLAPYFNGGKPPVPSNQVVTSSYGSQRQGMDYNSATYAGDSITMTVVLKNQTVCPSAIGRYWTTQIYKDGIACQYIIGKRLYDRY